MLPNWFKAMPHVAFSSLLHEEQMTVKKCPPFIDAMTYGFLMPLAADHYRFALERWIEQLFDGDEECIHVDVEDGFDQIGHARTCVRILPR